MGSESPGQTGLFPALRFRLGIAADGGGSVIEVGSVAREGLATGCFEQNCDATTTGLVHIGGKFSRIATTHLLAAASVNEEVARLVALSREWMLLQAQQLVACAAVHTAAQRVCRWLFSCHQRMETATITSTQEQIAALLGIRRTTVTLIAQNLQEKGIIDYRRGKIMIVDPVKLRSSACECCGKLGHDHWPLRRLAALLSEKPNNVQTTEAAK